MDTVQPHRLPSLVHTPASSEADIVSSKRTSADKTSKSSKRLRRRLGEHEKKIVANKRGKVCQSCRGRKIRCNHVSGFGDGVTTLPTPEQSNKRLQDVLGLEEADRHINADSQKWTIVTPQDFVQRATSSGWNGVQGSFHQSGMNRDISVGMNAKAMDPIVPPHQYLGYQSPIGQLMSPLSASPLENNNTAIYSAYEATESHIDLEFPLSPQFFSADQKQYETFEPVHQNSEWFSAIEVASTQHLASSTPNLKLTFQAPEPSSIIPTYQEHYHHTLYGFNAAIVQTPSNYDATPSLTFSPSTIKTGGESTAASPNLMDTPTRTELEGQEELDSSWFDEEMFAFDNAIEDSGGCEGYMAC